MAYTVLFQSKVHMKQLTCTAGTWFPVPPGTAKARALRLRDLRGQDIRFSQFNREYNTIDISVV